jgi:hypothetical protein
MDFVEGFPHVHGKLLILMVIDKFSKAAHFLPLGHPYTATSVVRVFFDRIVRVHGIPSSIVSDRDHDVFEVPRRGPAEKLASMAAMG